MRCKEIQEWLKADYLDNEANQEQARLIREHLAVCRHCREVEKVLQSQRSLFRQLKQQEVPVYLWQNIRERIMAERLNQEEGFGAKVSERLRNYLFAPKPVFVLARALAVVIFFALFATLFFQGGPVSSNGIYSLSSMKEDMVDDFGTSIEEYFL